MDHVLEQQKDLYDRKVHGRPLEVKELVWLHCPAVPKGKSKKLHTPWKGPFQVVSKLSDIMSDITHRIQDIQKHRRRLVVHFNHLKQCPQDIRFPVPPDDTLQSLTTISDNTPQELELNSLMIQVIMTLLP